MLRILKGCVVLGVWAVAIPAAAQEPKVEPMPMDLESGQGATPAASEESTDKPTSEKPATQPTSKDRQEAPASPPESSAPPPTPTEKPAEHGTYAVNNRIF